jgi:phosphatidylglycerophosphatase A
MILLVFAVLILVCGLQAVLSSMINRSSHFGLVLFCTGMLVSGLWVVLAKYSNNLIRDGLIWDVIIGMVFSLVFVWYGHANDFALKHWIGVVATFIVFVYWACI